MTPNRDQADLIERLKEAAAKATPGERKIAGACHVYVQGANICSVGEPRASTFVGYTELALSSKDGDEAYANAQFIALCSPDNILSLIDRLAITETALAIARSRLATTQSELDEAREALEPFARADKALGDEPGPFRFETANGHRLIEREDFRRARAATRTAGGDDAQ